MDVRDSDVVVVVVAVVVVLVVVAELVVVVVVTEVVAEEEQPQGTSVQWQSPLVLHQDPSRKASQKAWPQPWASAWSGWSGGCGGCELSRPDTCNMRSPWVQCDPPGDSAASSSALQREVFSPKISTI